MTDERVVGETRRADEASVLLQRSFPGLEVRDDRGSTPFSLRQGWAEAGPLRAGELRVRGALQATGALRPGAVAAAVVLSGRLDAEWSRRRVDTTQPFLRPAEPAVLRMRELHLRTVEVDVDRFRAAAERYTDGEGQRRRLHVRPVNETAAAAWRWTAERVHDALERGATANPIVREELFDHVVRMLLACFGEPSLRGGDVRVHDAPRAIRRAVAFLEEHAGGAITMPEVAGAAGISPRSLQVLFRRHLDVTPLAYLQAIRLDAARRDLLGGGSATAGSVHEVAERWGFGNSGRFARLYTERFGERPSETLRLR